MKITWRDKVTVIVGEMDRASALDCYKAIRDLAGMSADADLTLQSVREFVVRMAVEKAPAIVTVDGTLHREGSIDVRAADVPPFTLALPMRGAALDALPYALAEAWQMAALGENVFLEDWLKKVESVAETLTTPPPPTTNEPASDSGPSTASGEVEPSPMTKTTGA